MKRVRIDVNDYIGKKFNRLTILKETEPSKYAKTYTRNVLCKCDCGNEKIIDFSSILHGRSSSCGCFGREWSKKNATKHGLCMLSANKKHPDYTVWSKMKSRCLNPKLKDYKHYGGRGIKVCERWNSFENFIADMGWRPSKGFSIERDDVNGDYCPENCRWIPVRKQNRNTRKTIMIDYKGEVYCLTELCLKLNVDYYMMRHRITDLKMDFEDAIKYPKGKKLSKHFKH